MVPPSAGSESSLTLAENWAESAITVIPQSRQIPPTSQGLAP
jgi:hypothetical protein